jgi:hypothetical protein
LLYSYTRSPYLEMWGRDQLLDQRLFGLGLGLGVGHMVVSIQATWMPTQASITYLQQFKFGT